LVCQKWRSSSVISMSPLIPLDFPLHMFYSRY
jgi:hypothetical protein